MKESRLKVLQYVSGIAIFILAGWHILFSHFVEDEVTTWESVADRAADNWWFAFYVLLLIFGLYHGIHGLRTIILEYFSISDSSVQVLDYVLFIIGLAILGYGIYIPVDAL
ncbi:MAG: hypothetical protein R6U37_08430 [Dehalococcoidia bacterium]